MKHGADIKAKDNVSTELPLFVSRPNLYLVHDDTDDAVRVRLADALSHRMAKHHCTGRAARVISRRRR